MEVSLHIYRILGLIGKARWSDRGERDKGGVFIYTDLNEIKKISKNLNFVNLVFSVVNPDLHESFELVCSGFKLFGGRKLM